MYKKLNEATTKPAAWSAYTAEMLWADSHISKQMLTYHLNPNIEAASRSFDFIDESVEWLVSEFDLNESSATIDFGCGPGLYTHRFKKRGVGTVVGLDFSQNSIEYAGQQANESNFDIEYHLGNYLDYSDSRQFDLITLVMCDFCALNPSQRSTLLSKFKSLLKPTGAIALDVYTSTRFNKLEESLSIAKNSMFGFWSAEDYWCIQSSFLYDTDLVSLDKYVIYEEDRERTVYNWLQHFTIEMLSQELEEHGLVIQSNFSDLRGTQMSDGDELAVVVRHK